MKTDEKLDILIETEERIYMEIYHVRNALVSASGVEALSLTTRLLSLLRCLAKLKVVGRL